MINIVDRRDRVRLWLAFAPITILVYCVPAGCFAQAQQQVPRPTFDAASIKADTSPPVDQRRFALLATTGAYSGFSVSGKMVTFHGPSMRNLVAIAYGLDPVQVIGTAWMAQARFVVQAVMPDGSSREQIPEMFKALLEDRFHLHAHRSEVIQPGYAIVKGAGAIRLDMPENVDRTSCLDWRDDSTFSGAQICVVRE